MLARIFPKQLDNAYRGHWLALWLFAALLIVRLLIGGQSMTFAHNTAATADGIPLASFGPAAAATIVQMFALLGLHIFVMSLLGMVVLVRYRAMVPLIYLLLALQQIGQKILHVVYPDVPSAAASGAPGGIVSLVILAATFVGFALSLVERPPPPLRSSSPLIR